MKISIEEAQKLLLEKADVLECEETAITNAWNRIAAEDLVANMTQPPFARSSMDGYAVKKADVEGVLENAPVLLPVSGVCYAGDAPLPLSKGYAVRIMTGAPVPPEADLVIPQEMTDYGEETVKIFSNKVKNNNIVPAGEDFYKGDILLDQGRTIGSYAVAAGIAGNVTKIKVRKKIRAAVITTGSELVSPGNDLKPGQIYNSSLGFFTTRLLGLDCEVVKAVSVADDPAEIQRMIKETAECADLILTTGGVSVGKKDYLPQVIENLGAQIIFRQMDIKPGSPTMASKYGHTTIFSLSGNPYSAIAMFELLYPYYEMKAMQRQSCREFTFQTFTINGFAKKSPKRRIVRGVFKEDGVYIPQGQRNGQLSAGIGCNCLVDIPAGSDAIEAGELVTVRMYH